ncbi:MAG TPA: MBL fold metallo-hydrolase [Terracidiphilus sp.]|nr:MBL fold metallo-hydrolase [Terracidiphilus sp.]
MGTTLRTRLSALSLIVFFSFVFAGSPPQAAAKSTSAGPLRIYTIDVEGGQSTLIVAPSGHSMLVDTGWPDNHGRDADRILATMHKAGITRLDKVFITHFHTDHVGGVPNLVQRVQVGEFLDHGVNREDSDITRHDFAAYLKAIAGTKRRIVHPGDTISIPGLSIVVLAADGEHIHAIPGITPQPNPYCATERKWEADPSENARSAGFLLRYGKFSFLDLGDLTGAKEVALVCPANPIGHVDLYLVDHHGMDLSNSRALVDAIHPVVAIMDNGAHKAGMPQAWQTVHDSPGIRALYMLHTAEGSDAAHNSPAPLIANLKGGTDGNDFAVVASSNGSFSVTNSRTGNTENYPAK